MSHTNKGSKGAGYEYWSRRPGSGMRPSKKNKQIIHKLERAKEKILVDKERKNYDMGNN